MGDRTIAYFSMEIALEPTMPTYSGGLGALAGDTVRSAADLRVPMVAVSLLHRKGYFFQRLDAAGNQSEEPADWPVDDFVKELPPRASVTIDGRNVLLRAWRFEVRGVGGYIVPVYLLDADLPENAEWDRGLTHYLYGGDEYYRLCQEVVLGIGGVRMLQALGHGRIERYHLNEGHASLLTLELLRQEAERAGRPGITGEDVQTVRERCIFTTHTPVPAGHDQFPLDLVRRVLGPGSVTVDTDDGFAVETIKHLFPHAVFPQGGEFTGWEDLARRGAQLNMTYLALSLSHYINGVAKKHGEVTRLLFADYTIDAITNGVHASTWAAPPFQGLYDLHIPGWREDNFSLRYALSIPREELWQTHLKAKRELLEQVNRETNAGMDSDVLTLGFARRAATYKRTDLLFADPERLRDIAKGAAKLQVVYAGKAHPRDEAGKEMIRRVFRARDALRPHVRVAYLANYDTSLGRLLAGGVDLWLNTPQPPNEASGTSGMKAALNGVPSFSVLDGWWIEGHIEGVTGWSIGGRGPQESHDYESDSRSLYDKLEGTIIPLFYGERSRFIDVMRHAIALNGSFFNTQRMLQQYVVKAYFPRD